MIYVSGHKMSNLREESYPPTATLASFPALKYDTLMSTLKGCRKDLEAAFGQENILDANFVREAHLESGWSSYTAEAGEEPLIVVPQQYHEILPQTATSGHGLQWWYES